MWLALLWYVLVVVVSVTVSLRLKFRPSGLCVYLMGVAEKPRNRGFREISRDSVKSMNSNLRYRKLLMFMIQIEAPSVGLLHTAYTKLSSGVALRLVN